MITIAKEVRRLVAKVDGSWITGSETQKGDNSSQTPVTSLSEQPQ